MIKNYPHNNESAYLMGVALGDGDISVVGRSLKLRLYCDNKYPNLMNKWKRTCENIFNGKANVIPRGKNVSAVYTYSKTLSEFPWKPRSGKKWEQGARIPLWIREDNELYCNCILGLLESDGSEYVQNVKIKGKTYSYDRLNFSNSSEELVKDVLDFLDNNSISYTVYERKPKHRCHVCSSYIEKRTTNYCVQIIDHDKLKGLLGIVGDLKS